MLIRAYLVNGEFRIHRADCGDCPREARHSDSTARPEEHRDQAGVIAALWADIISEDPDFYAPLAGWPRYTPAPSSSPAPAGCPPADSCQSPAARTSRRGRDGDTPVPAASLSQATPPSPGRGAHHLPPVGGLPCQGRV
jgi:hypothetical protein